MNKRQTEITVKGMDCAGCARSVKQALEQLDGVEAAQVLLSSEKAQITTSDSCSLDLPAFKKAVEDIGYHVPGQGSDGKLSGHEETKDLARRSFRLFGLVFGLILLVIVGGEWMGLFQKITVYVPFWVGTLIVLITGYPVFKKVIQAALNKQVTPHALMALGALSALAAGEWVTAAIVVFFMRTGDFIEHYTTDKARDSIRTLTDLAPQSAVRIVGGEEQEVPVSEIRKGDHIVVRSGAQIPVDGHVLEGSATVNEASITGESRPVFKKTGAHVYASTIAQGGRLLVQTDASGQDTTFGKIITMVEEAEANKGEVQRYADTFSAWYLPVVAGIALLTYLIRSDVMATVAVMVVACSCAFALATPVALLATIGSSAKRGLIIKGGKYIESLAKADLLLIDKTGTLTLGRPSVTDILPRNGISEDELISIAASTEHYSTHPLAKAIIAEAEKREISYSVPGYFEELAGNGVRAKLDGDQFDVRKSSGNEIDLEQDLKKIRLLKGKTVMKVLKNRELIGYLAARDTERTESQAAIQRLKELRFDNIELLTGDNRETASEVAGRLGIAYRAELLPEDKIEIVREAQEEGHTVIMIGDGVNDAPALAQADVGIAMGGSGTDIAIETADITLMRDDWNQVPELFLSARRTMRVIKWNFGFTTLYNVLGLSLAAFGFLPPILAAAAQSLPDVGIMLNSSRLLKSRRE